MKPRSSVLSVVVICFWSAVVPANGQVNVTQFHNHDSRDGLYVDSAFTLSAAAHLARDLNFDGTIVGNVYAQPLYIDDGPRGRPAIIAVTESNNVYALDALDGSIIWQANVGEPLSAGVPCTVIDPLGITGTPIVDLASRALFLAAMITPDGGTTKKHLILSLNVDTGDINPGWPVDVEATASYNGINFTPESQLQRAALGIVGDTLYVGYASHSDCSLYHGWLVGVPIDNPASVTAWAAATTAGTHGGAIWGVGGIASDGKNPFVTTGNTFGTNGNWDGGEAVIRFQPGPIFSGLPSDYWVPTNWLQLDNADLDLGASGPLLVDVPGATPSSLVVVLGKDGKAYLLNRGNLGGIAAPVASLNLSNNPIIQAAATYRTNQGTYVAYRVFPGDHLGAFRITATNPPSIVDAWSVNRDGCGSPFVTSTDGTSNMIVWVVGTSDSSGEGGDQRLHGYDGDTGAVVYAGGGANELMAGTYSYTTTGIAARGRIYVAGNNKVYAFAAPTLTSTLGNVSTRAFVQTGDNVVIGGFIVQGTQTKRVIIRAIGPELTQYGIPNALANPTLELHDGTGALIASNNNWATTIIGGIITANQVQDIRSSGYAPGDELESAIIADLAPGNYTAIVRGVNNMTGVGLVEVYDLSADASSILGNISTRAFVQTDENVMIGGFIVQGTQPKRVIIRAIGPELTQYGVPDPLADPTLELHDVTGALIASNDNWQHTIIGGIIASDQVSDIMNSGHAPTQPSESAIIADLPAGNYTAIVRGVSNTTGVALAEVYDLDQ